MLPPHIITALQNWALFKKRKEKKRKEKKRKEKKRKEKKRKEKKRKEKKRKTTQAAKHSNTQTLPAPIKEDETHWPEVQ